MRMLRQGDACPCCGQPIKTDDPAALHMLSWIRHTGRMPAVEEIEAIGRMYRNGEGDHRGEV